MNLFSLRSMCKYLVTTLLLLNIQAVLAQEQDSGPSFFECLSVRAGVNFASLSTEYQASNEDPFPDSRIGFTIGLGSEIILRSTLSVQTEIFYTQKGGESGENAYTDESRNLLGKSNTVRSLEYIEIPITVKFNPDPGIFGQYLLIGPSVAYLISAKDELLGSATDVKEDLESFNIGIVIGAGLKYQTSAVTILLEGRYTFGLTNLIKEAQGVTQKSRDIAILAGVIF